VILRIKGRATIYQQAKFNPERALVREESDAMVKIILAENVPNPGELKSPGSGGGKVHATQTKGRE